MKKKLLITILAVVGAAGFIAFGVIQKASVIELFFGGANGCVAGMIFGWLLSLFIPKPKIEKNSKINEVESKIQHSFDVPCERCSQTSTTNQVRWYAGSYIDHESTISTTRVNYKITEQNISYLCSSCTSKITYTKILQTSVIPFFFHISFSFLLGFFPGAILALTGYSLSIWIIIVQGMFLHEEMDYKGLNPYLVLCLWPICLLYGPFGFLCAIDNPNYLIGFFVAFLIVDICCLFSAITNFVSVLGSNIIKRNKAAYVEHEMITWNVCQYGKLSKR